MEDMITIRICQNNNFRPGLKNPGRLNNTKFEILQELICRYEQRKIFMFTNKFYMFIFFVAVIILITISNTCIASDKSLKYISPGLRIGWEFGRGLTISLKISLGINTDPDFDDNPKYYNITLGSKVPLFRKTKYLYEEYDFIELQAGCTPFKHNGLFAGGGLGFMFYQDNNKTKFRPMVTFDFIFLENKKISTDFGFLGIMPFPLNKGKPWFD